MKVEAKTQIKVLKMLSGEIEIMPSKEGGNKVSPTVISHTEFIHHMADVGGISITDVMMAAVNILSIISGIITVGDFSYRLWKQRREEAINQTLQEIVKANRFCSEDDAERIIIRAFEMMGIKYPPVSTENSAND